MSKEELMRKIQETGFEMCIRDSPVIVTAAVPTRTLSEYVTLKSLPKASPSTDTSGSFAFPSYSISLYDKSKHLHRRDFP